MNIGKIRPTEITEEMKSSYLDYAMSVIVARALPDVRDGLKPVHRRILFAMKEMNLISTSSYKKSARIVGEVLGKYHPHGDMAVYDALVRLAQDFSMRYPLIDGQGNFGSVDGDSPAAMRYTEARLKKISNELLHDLDKETVDFIDNFDGSQKEPTVLPSRIPNLLLMGSDGIAVGMATKIPPHNLTEVVDALLVVIEKGKAIKIDKVDKDVSAPVEIAHPSSLVGKFASETTVDDLLQKIKGPDFPTGGAIYGHEEIKEAYATGRGKILVRATTRIEEDKKGKLNIIVSELPYQVNKARLVIKIADLVRKKRIKNITALRDESDREGMRLVIEVKKKGSPQTVLNHLFQYTEMQTTFPVNMVALVNGIPQTLNLKNILHEYLLHRQIITVRRSQFELKQAKKRSHILEGLMIALDHLDEVIATIRQSQNSQIAKKELMTKFSLTEIQAEAILEMKLRQLTQLERETIEDEYKMLQETINYLIALLSSPEKILLAIKEELEQVKKDFGDQRRTRVFLHQPGKFSELDLVPSEEVIVIITKSGYIKRVPKNIYRSQRRGGKGVIGMTTKDEDEISHLLTANTHEEILFFTDRGRVYKLPVWELPEGLKSSKGQAVINLIGIESGENVCSIITINPKNKNEKQYFLIATRQGLVKKTAVSEFANIKANGLIAIDLQKDDHLCGVTVISPDNQIILVTESGKSIRFSEKDVRPTKRDTQGVMGIRLQKNDAVVLMDSLAKKIIKPEDNRKKFFRDLLVVFAKGLGKRTPISEYPLQKRGGVGVKVAQLTSKTGKVICAHIVTQKTHQVVLTSKQAQMIKLPLKNIPTLHRPSQGVILMRFGKNADCLAAMTCVEFEEES